MQTINKLQEIAIKLEIKADEYFVRYPNYRHLQHSINVITQLQKLPENIQDDYLISLLTSLIFAIYRHDLLVIDNSQTFQSDYEIWLQNVAWEVDWEFCKQLSNNNQGTGWWNQKLRIIREELDGSLVLEKKGIITHIQRKSHLRLEEQSAVVGDLVSVFTPTAQVINQFYAAFGDATNIFIGGEVFIYFNFTPEGALNVMKFLTTRLNTIKASFIFYVLHNPSNYGRYDSGFLRTDKQNYELIRQVLLTVYLENKSHFQNQVPLFTKMLAPGLGLAEKPDYAFQFLDDFGMNRSQIVANGLLEAHKSGDESPEARMKYILKQFEKYEIDIEHPYLNPNSEDIYTPLDLD